MRSGEVKPSARRPLRDNRSPGGEAPHDGVGRSPGTRRKEAVSPRRPATRSHRLKTEDELSSDEEDEVNKSGDDVVDRSAQATPPRLYPDLDLNSPTSPGKNEEKELLDASFYSARTSCIRRGGQSSPESPPPPETKRDTQGLIRDRRERDDRRGVAPLLVILFSFIIIIAFVMLLQSLAREQELERNKPYVKPIGEVYEDLKVSLKHIHNMFRQERALWVQVFSQLDSIVQDAPLQPAVLLVVVPEDARGTATCLVHSIAHAVSDAFGDNRFIMFDVKSHSNIHHSEKLKEDLDESLTELYSSHAAIMHNVEKIPGRAAMIFHAYCDNENAPHKQAVLFLTVELTSHYADVVNSRLDSTIDQYLTRVWGAELENKDVSSLVSRVANAPILVRPESDERVRMLCPL